MIQIASTPRSRGEGASIEFDPSKGRLFFKSWFDGNYAGGSIDIAWVDLVSLVANEFGQEAGRRWAAERAEV